MDYIIKNSEKKDNFGKHKIQHILPNPTFMLTERLGTILIHVNQYVLSWYKFNKLNKGQRDVARLNKEAVSDEVVIRDLTACRVRRAG